MWWLLWIIISNPQASCLVVLELISLHMWYLRHSRQGPFSFSGRSWPYPRILFHWDSIRSCQVGEPILLKLISQVWITYIAFFRRELYCRIQWLIAQISLTQARSPHKHGGVLWGLASWFSDSEGSITKERLSKDEAYLWQRFPIPNVFALHSNLNQISFLHSHQCYYFLRSIHHHVKFE